MDQGPTIKVRVKTKEIEPEDGEEIQMVKTPTAEEMVKRPRAGKIQIDIKFTNMNITEPEYIFDPKTTEESLKLGKDNITGVKRRRMSYIAASEAGRATKYEETDESGDESPEGKQIRLTGLRFNSGSEDDIGTLFQRETLVHIDKLRKFEDAANARKMQEIESAKLLEIKPKTHMNISPINPDLQRGNQFEGESKTAKAKQEVLKEIAETAAKVAKLTVNEQNELVAVEAANDSNAIAVAAANDSDEKSNINRVMDLLAKASLEYKANVENLELKVSDYTKTPDDSEDCDSEIDKCYHGTKEEIDERKQADKVFRKQWKKDNKKERVVFSDYAIEQLRAANQNRVAEEIAERQVEDETRYMKFKKLEEDVQNVKEKLTKEIQNARMIKNLRAKGIEAAKLFGCEEEAEREIKAYEEEAEVSVFATARKYNALVSEYLVEKSINENEEASIAEAYTSNYFKPIEEKLRSSAPSIEEAKDYFEYMRKLKNQESEAKTSNYFNALNYGKTEIETETEANAKEEASKKNQERIELKMKKQLWENNSEAYKELVKSNDEAYYSFMKKYDVEIKSTSDKIVEEADEYNSDEQVDERSYSPEMPSLCDYDSDKDSIYDLKEETSDDQSDDQSDDDDEESLDIFTVTPRRCCSDGARRLVIIADASWPLVNKRVDEPNTIVPKIAVVSQYHDIDPELTEELLSQPSNWEVNKNSMSVWIGTQKNKNIRRIENMNATVRMYLENEKTGIKSKSMWQLNVEICKKQEDKNNDCCWCSRRNLEWIDGHSCGWLEGENSPNMEPYFSEDDVVVIKESDDETIVGVMDNEKIKPTEVRSMGHTYKYEDIAWPKTRLAKPAHHEEKPVYNEETGKFENIKYPELIPTRLGGTR